MFIYQDLSFRVIEKEDLEILRKLHNDPSTWMNLLNIDFIDEEDQIEWWKNLHKKKNDQRYVICFAEKPEEIIGRLRIQNINWLHKNCEIGLDILPEYRGKGFGKKSYEMVLEFLFNHYNMHMVYLKVADFNPNAKKLYEKVGFKETGRLPQFYFRHGKYWDYIIMSMLKDEYQKA
ncbi:GNAT family N-acetyltransferase [Melioribacter sp. OK-6-Me]|uniref:GNAT family N-acetyltransferase n=1 Tax=Melioribacter sp. OK-6-Me TaxID=3423433 RepID=UPI003EDB2E09